MKKILICLFIMIFSCGCSATYNLEINDNGFKEESTFYENDSNLFNKSITNGKTYRELVENVYNNPMAIFYNNQNNDFETGIVEGKEYYNSKLIDDGRLGLIYSYNFSENNYLDSYVLNLCFDSKNIYKEGSVTVLTSSKGFTCFDYYDYLTDVTVNIITDYKVTSSNADSVIGNTYTWNITKDNAASKIIFIKYKIILEENPKEEKKTFSFWKENWLGLVIILIILFLAGVFTFNLVMKKNNENNKL